MKSASELTDYYYKVLHADLQELEAERLKLKNRVTQVETVVVLLTLGVIAAISNLNDGALTEGTFAVAMIGFAIGGMIYKIMIKDYVSQFKFKVIRPLIEAIESGLLYNPLGLVSQSLFERSQLFNHRIDRYRGNDHVSGIIDGVPIQFSDLHAEYKTTDSKGRTSWHTLFQGLFIVSEFNKHFNGKTVVLPDTAEKMLGSLVGGWFQSKNGSHGELVKMDDPEFEKHFVVYGSDQIEARYILTHAMMKRLLDFQKRSKAKLYVAFVGERIILAVATSHDHFEPTVFKSLLDYKQAMEYVNQLRLAIGIVEELKLNQKLWSKQ